MDGQRNNSALYSMMPHDASSLAQVRNGTSIELSSKDSALPPPKESPSPPLKDACPSKGLSSEAVSSIAQRKRETFAEQRTITISISNMDYPYGGNSDDDEKKGKTLEEDKKEDYNPVGALAFDMERGFTGYNYKTLVEIPHHKEITTTKLLPKERKKQWQMKQHQTLPILEDDNPIGALDMERGFIDYKILAPVEKLHSRQHRPPNQPTPHPHHLVEKPHPKETATRGSIDYTILALVEKLHSRQHRPPNQPTPHPQPHHKETATMKLVAKGRFFKKHWQMKQHQTIPILATAILFVMFALLHELLLKRRSGQKECIKATLVVDTQPKNESTEVQDRQSPCDADDEDEGPVCWICLEEGPDESGHPLRRDCSCRGESAGFAHISCLARHAEQKAVQWDGYDLRVFREPWKVCPNCCQDYQNDLAVNLADEFVTFVEGKWPGDQKHLVAVYLKLMALQLHDSATEPKQKEEAKETANKMFSMIGEMKLSNPSPQQLPPRTLLMEAIVNNFFGIRALELGTEEGAKTAVEHFEKCRDISKSINHVVAVSAAESNIAFVKSKYGESSKLYHAKLLEKRQALLLDRLEQSGESAQTTITTSLNLASDLSEANRSIEAERLVMKLVAICKRVHGPDHGLTKTTESNLLFIKKRYVTVIYQTEPKRRKFQVRRYEEDEKRYLIQGPIEDPRNTKTEKPFTIVEGVFLPGLGTPVVCHGLEESAPHLNGKIGDLISHDEKFECYEVHFEDKSLAPCSVKRENIRIIFDLPPVE